MNTISMELKYNKKNYEIDFFLQHRKLQLSQDNKLKSFLINRILSLESIL